MILKLLLPDKSGRNHLHAWLASGVNDTGELKKKINIKLQFFLFFCSVWCSSLWVQWPLVFLERTVNMAVRSLPAANKANFCILYNIFWQTRKSLCVEIKNNELDKRQRNEDCFLFFRLPLKRLLINEP